MTAEQAELLRIIRHHCQGLAGARTIDSLVAMLGVRGFRVARRWAEATIHSLSLRGYPVGTGCVGATKGVFWIRNDGDWAVAYENIDMRFRPLGQRRRALLDLKRRKFRPLRITDGTGTAQIEVGADGRIERTPTDRAGHAMLFDVAAGQSASPARGEAS